MKYIYIINEEKGFDKIFDKENITDINVKKEILKGLNLITLRVEIEEKEGQYYEFIFDEKNIRKRLNDFNPYHKGLINTCFNHCIGIVKDLNEFIELQ
ncbi:hypothetical protein ACF122_002896 [Clostridioides difficile]|uniref:hypothetical protein n=1 Tax=Clostridioides difficile TaxID=1496 RepID=UPI0008A2F8F6|nr:hypothetical protein [Clostridioides difficile]OFU08982.1 hypothetical protein HMPREF3083_03140 [Clostridium sp. HMSC19D07]MBH7476126.1 hypothetical protein [Clostridioides difficile]MBY2508846.1 hypothetical protein [Clostridioides difficile]MCE4722457.1 hypothetical protein [Clostridioides difficile]MCG3580331.1 hypothetical protein [Clostridioides difficile]